MKKIYVLFAILAIYATGYAADLTLTTPETLAVPTATKIRVGRVLIDRDAKFVVCEYKFIAADANEIPATSGSVNRIFRCENLSAEAAALCTGPGVPYQSCTGIGTGNCYDDVFLFNIRQADVGKSIGQGLWQLIWSKMKNSVLSAGNDAN